MKSFLLCSLLVLVPTAALASLTKHLPIFSKPPTSVTAAISPIESKLNAFLDADDVDSFTQWLKQENVDANTAAGKYNASLLHLTASSGKVLFVDRLLKAGAEVEITDQHGLTPLDAAEFWERPAVVVRLREAGAVPVDLAEAEGLGDAETLHTRRSVHNYLMREVLPKFTPRVNYLTVCGDWLLGCLSGRSLFTTREQVERSKRKFRGRTLLQEAVAQEKGEIVELLLMGRKYRRILFEEDEHGWLAIHFAAFYDNTTALEMLRAKGADINAVVYSSQHTPLTLAALMGHTASVQHLLAMGANPAARHHLGMDALQLAVLGMHSETVKVLLEYGLPEETIAAARKLAIEKNLTRQGYVELLKLLDDAVPRVPVRLNKQGITALQQAVWDEDTLRLKEILARDKSLLHETDSVGWTVAHDAAFIGHADMMELLYSAGADFKAVAPRGDTPALLAAERGNLAALDFLIKIDAVISATTPAGENILHLAVEGEHIRLVRYLVHRGVNLRLRTNAGESALDIAKRIGNQKMIDLLDRIEIGFYAESGRFYIGPADEN